MFLLQNAKIINFLKIISNIHKKFVFLTASFKKQAIIENKKSDDDKNNRF